MEPGHKMIKIFKEHLSKTCILDDFGFYESRQKTIQEKKAKQQHQFQKQVNTFSQLMFNFCCLFFSPLAQLHLCNCLPFQNILNLPFW